MGPLFFLAQRRQDGFLEAGEGERVAEKLAEGDVQGIEKCGGLGPVGFQAAAVVAKRKAIEGRPPFSSAFDRKVPSYIETSIPCAWISRAVMLSKSVFTIVSLTSKDKRPSHRAQQAQF
jgi:hypothetical protein